MFSISRLLGRHRHTLPEEAAYRRLAEKGFCPRSIIDVGAYEGNWARIARRIFPNADVLMVEAQAGKRVLLEQVCSELGAQLVSAPLSERSGELATFYEMETGSSLLPELSNVPRRECVLMTTTLDEIAAKLQEPIFLKIDVQGAELKVLEGGCRTLERSDLVQLEVGLLPYNEGAPTFVEVITYMENRGFVPYDLAGGSRPNGIDLVQIDLLFTHRHSPLRPSFFHF